jgi:hypothetical protein
MSTEVAALAGAPAAEQVSENNDAIRVVSHRHALNVGS